MVTGCLRRLGAYDLGDEWQDLCQEVVWALVRAVREGRAPADHAASSYIGSIVHNQFITWLRKRGVRATETDAMSDSADERADVARGMRAVAASNHTDAVERIAARRALGRLPREWQSLLVAHYVEGCTIDALVSVNGTSRATLNRELKRAREAFCAALAGREGGSS
jgi:RNA polymerase sigma factor (sigma-70 family)